MALEHRPLGRTGLAVSRLGFGAMQIGDPEVTEPGAASMLAAALDLGITLIDTAPAYGLSEARIGRHLANRRDEFVLSTKLGYGVDGVADWTAACIEAGVDQALRRLRTDRLDIAHLHSCPIHVLAHAGVIDALERARDAGKVRAMAYSGDGNALAYAVASGRFDVVQASVSVVDQANLDHGIAAASAAGIGCIAKRPLAGAPWRCTTPPDTPDGRAYVERWRAMASQEVVPEDVGASALRFVLSVPGVDTCLVGGTNPGRLGANVGAAAAGPLGLDEVTAIRDAFRRLGAAWPAII